MKIGFIGQGYIGKNMADDFEDRGYEVVRYALEPEYQNNRETISECDVVFISVPTPTTEKGSDHSIVEEVLALVGKNKTAVIKSTILPGTTRELQEKYPHLKLLFSPEFLSKVTAKEDARKPILTIMGLPQDDDEYHNEAQKVLQLLPKTENTFITTS